MTPLTGTTASDVSRVGIQIEQIYLTCEMGWHRSTGQRFMQVNSETLLEMANVGILEGLPSRRVLSIRTFVLEKDCRELILR
jgi:hypothetical protein